jgi:hypothetical protein
MQGNFLGDGIGTYAYHRQSKIGLDPGFYTINNAITFCVEPTCIFRTVNLLRFWVVFACSCMSLCAILLTEGIFPLLTCSHEKYKHKSIDFASGIVHSRISLTETFANDKRDL